MTATPDELGADHIGVAIAAIDKAIRRLSFSEKTVTVTIAARLAVTLPTIGRRYQSAGWGVELEYLPPHPADARFSIPTRCVLGAYGRKIVIDAVEMDEP